MFPSGTWVKFSNHVDSAHRTRDGYTLGIWVNSGIDAASGKQYPTHVVPVDENGMDISDPETPIFKLILDPRTLENLHRMTDLRDIPEARLVFTDMTWKP